MPKEKQTGQKAATSASKTLQNESTGKDSKSGAGSAMSQRKAPEKKTSDAAAESASDVLKDGRTNKDSKAASGSALSQKESAKKASDSKKK